MKKAVFLDRDGTINFDVGYLSRISDISIFEGVVSSLKSLKDASYLNLIITNQSGIARGLFSESDLHNLHDEFKRLLSYGGIALIDDFFYSPYHIDGIIKEYSIESSTRKPGTGMIEEAVNKYGIDVSKSYFIGDSIVDMKCAENAGLKKILVMTGYGSKTIEECREQNIFVDFCAESFSKAANYIIFNEKS